MAGFEELARQADGTTSLVYWARNVTAPVPPLASRAAEEALFRRRSMTLEVEEFDPLSRRLEREPSTLPTAAASGVAGPSRRCRGSALFH